MPYIISYDDLDAYNDDDTEYDGLLGTGSPVDGEPGATESGNGGNGPGGTWSGLQHESWGWSGKSLP